MHVSPNYYKKKFMIISKKFHPTNIKKRLFAKYKNDKFII